MVESDIKCRCAASTSCLVRHRTKGLIKTNGGDGLTPIDEGCCGFFFNKIDYWRCFIIAAAEVYRALLPLLRHGRIVLDVVR